MCMWGEIKEMEKNMKTRELLSTKMHMRSEDNIEVYMSIWK